MYTAALLLAILLFGIIAHNDRKNGLFLLLALLPTYALRFEILTIPSTFLEMLALILLFLWFVQDRPWKRFELTSPVTRISLLFLAAASFAVVVSPNTFAALGIWKAYFLEPILLAFLARDICKKDDVPNVLLALSLPLMANVFFALFQVATGIGIPAPWDAELRATGLFAYPNALGLFIAPITTAAFFMAQTSKTWRVYWIAIFLLGCVGVLLSQTEAALIAIPASILLSYMCFCKTRQHRLVSTALLFLFAVLTICIPFTREKLLLQDYSGQVRISQWQETVQLLIDHPVFGAGLSGYPTIFADYHDPMLYEIFQYPHTLLFNIWTELGLLGMFAFLWLCIYLFAKTKSAPYSTQKLALFAALLTMTIHGLVDVPYFKNDLAILTWICIAGLILLTTDPGQTSAMHHASGIRRSIQE